MDGRFSEFKYSINALTSERTVRSLLVLGKRILVFHSDYSVGSLVLGEVNYMAGNLLRYVEIGKDSFNGLLGLLPFRNRFGCHGAIDGTAYGSSRGKGWHTNKHPNTTTSPCTPISEAPANALGRYY